MKRSTIALILAVVAAVPGWTDAFGQDPPGPVSDREPPIAVEKVEVERVRLLLLDAIVVDRQGRTVPDLTLEDFEVISRGREFPLDTLDVNCPAGRADDAVSVRHPSKRPPPAAPGAPRRIVLAFDYQHLRGIPLVDALEQAQEMVEHGEANEEFMIVALTGGPRIEQQFTADREQIARSLHRMEYDISLWNGNFAHLNETGFVQGMTTMFDVLSTVPGTKAVVLFSTMQDVPLDLEFREIAAVASASRCKVYPVDCLGLTAQRGAVGVGPSGAQPASQAPG